MFVQSGKTFSVLRSQGPSDLGTLPKLKCDSVFVLPGVRFTIFYVMYIYLGHDIVHRFKILVLASFWVGHVITVLK